MGTEFVRYEARHLGLLATLQTRLWGTNADLNARYFDWKHARNPCGSDPDVFLAMQDGRAVAMRGFVASRWEGGREAGAPLLLPLAADSVVDPAHEGTGVTAPLTAFALEALARRGLPCVLNLRASPVTLVNALAAGWRATAPFEVVVHGDPHADNPLRTRVMNLPVLWRLAPHRLLDSTEERRPFAQFDRHGPTALRPISRHLSIVREPRVAEMAALVARLPHDGRLRQLRDAAWLTWKYANPARAYRFVCWDDGGLQGFVALEKSTAPGSDRLRVFVADCEATDDAVMAMLLQATLAALPDQALFAWRRAVPAAGAAALDGLGFRPLPTRSSTQRRCLLVKALGANGWRLRGLDLTDLASWDLRYLYGD